MIYSIMANVNHDGTVKYEEICKTDSIIKKKFLEDFANLVNCNIFEMRGLDSKMIDLIRKKEREW